MAQVINKRQLEIFECETDDGGVGLQFGDGAVQVGVGESDLMRLLAQVFDLRDTPSHIDAELHDLAQMYLDEEAAQARQHHLRTFDEIESKFGEDIPW